MKQLIIIKDELGAAITKIRTDRPEWSFEQYCRNRITPGWSYDIAGLK